jgi:hypothetical protein
MDGKWIPWGEKHNKNKITTGERMRQNVKNLALWMVEFCSKRVHPDDNVNA